MLLEISTYELASVLDRVARRALQAARIVRPPIDAFLLAEALGLSVHFDQRQDGRARVVRLSALSGAAGRSAIFLRPDPRPERLQWAVAHELGEHLAVEVFATMGSDAREAPVAAREQIANQLAGRLLVPSTWLQRHGARCDWNLRTLKQKFRTASHELVARRMLDRPGNLVVSLFDQGRRVWRKTNLPGQLPPVSDVEREAQQAAHQLAEDQSREGDLPGMAVEAWALHEPAWQREIVCVHYPEGGDEWV